MSTDFGFVTEGLLFSGFGCPALDDGFDPGGAVFLKKSARSAVADLRRRCLTSRSSLFSRTAGECGAVRDCCMGESFGVDRWRGNVMSTAGATGSGSEGRGLLRFELERRGVRVGAFSCEDLRDDGRDDAGERLAGDRLAA